MLLKRIYDEDLAHASYLIGCQAHGTAIVVDPRRDVDVYLDIAEKNGMTITAVTETHIHADYLSGTRELADRTGATMYVSDEGGPDWTYGSAFDGAVRMKDGHEIVLGKVTIRAVHTPGHTPEHLSFLITDGAQADGPGFLLTGDFVFVGDVGRPDLLDEAAGGIDTRFGGARDLFASLRERFLTLPDYVQVLPAHGSGSACGKALGAIPATTVGYERAFSWWSGYVREGDEQGFVDELLAGQPDAHAYFARMKTQNRVGPAVLGESADIVEFAPEQLREALDADEIVFVDTRHHSEVYGGTVARSLNIPAANKPASYAGWAIDPEREQRPLVVLAADAAGAADFRDHLVRVGIDTVTGFVPTLDGLELVAPARIDPSELDGFERAMLLDVRNATEFAEGHLPGAVHVSAGRALWQLDRLPTERAIVAYCRSGARNSVIASALRRAGCDVVELDGSYAGWTAVAGNVPVTAETAAVA